MNTTSEILAEARAIAGEMRRLLAEGIIPFWLERSVDTQYGGYLTCFDERGMFTGNGTKYLVTQGRMIWGFSNLREFARPEARPAMEAAARQGVDFLLGKFWDDEYKGFFWQLNRDGSVADASKLVYGEGFAIYALAEYALTYGDERALDYASQTFDLLQKYAADTELGGYYENIERDWRLSPAGAYAGDRKSLDIHMHLLEAYTTLYRATGREIHGRRLNEVMNLIFRHMVNTEKGYGYNQFDLAFNRLPAINIMRTWNAERETNETIAAPTDTTSYGHNVELSWLADAALSALGQERGDREEVLLRLLDHALQFGYDDEYGGVYRDGVADQSVLVYDKEWWQNFEAMTGFLNGYAISGDVRYWDAFRRTWRFDRDCFIIPDLGESRQLLMRDGTPVISSIGNPWKGIYHTGRALAECLRRLDAILSEGL